MAELRFIPRNPQKYAGDAQRIVARSRWELVYMQALDSSNLVTKWISEPRTLNITYLSPLDKKLHQYWPDFLVQYTDGSLEILEIKPMKESHVQMAKSTYDKLMLVKNIAKWQAADKFAKSIGARFRVITENHLFAKSATRPTKKSKPTQSRRKVQGISK